MLIMKYSTFLCKSKSGEKWLENNPKLPSLFDMFDELGYYE